MMTENTYCDVIATLTEDKPMMSFMDHLMEAYRKKVTGRTEFKLGNKTKVIVNPNHLDITRHYNVNIIKKA